MQLWSFLSKVPSKLLVRHDCFEWRNLLLPRIDSFDRYLCCSFVGELQFPMHNPRNKA